MDCIRRFKRVDKTQKEFVSHQFVGYHSFILLLLLNSSSCTFNYMPRIYDVELELSWQLISIQTTGRLWYEEYITPNMWNNSRQKSLRKNFFKVTRTPHPRLEIWAKNLTCFNLKVHHYERPFNPRHICELDSFFKRNRSELNQF